MQEPERIWSLLSLDNAQKLFPRRAAAASWDVSKVIGSASSKTEGDK